MELKEKTWYPADTPLLFALNYEGIKELPGPKSTDEIKEMIDWMMGGDNDDSKVAWCSIFLNWVCYQTGFERSGKPNARSWMNHGSQVDLAEAKVGDVAIFWRESRNSWKGHVGFFINKRGKQIRVLGGNQENGVNISPYPVSRLLKIVRLSHERGFVNE